MRITDIPAKHLNIASGPSLTQYLLLCSHSHNDVAPEPERNVSDPWPLYSVKSDRAF